MKKNIPLSVPNLRGKEKEYVLDAIEKEWVSTGGSYIDQLEKDIAKYLNVEGAVACQSGTAGLHLALILSGVEAHDEVIVPTLTFIAAVNPVKYIGAEPVFMDCDDGLTVDANKLRLFCEQECEFVNGSLKNRKTGRTVKALIVVHVFGNNADLEQIMLIAQKYNLKVIEDATEALGSYYVEGKYKNKYLGTIGDFGVYSFNGNKIITTGGGGMLVASDKEMLRKAKYLSTQAKDDPLFYVHNEVGYNYRMTNVQAAIGVAQLEQLEDFISTKARNYHTYKRLLEAQGFKLIDFNPEIRPNYWFYSLLVENAQQSIRKIIGLLQERGVQTRPIWELNHRQLPYASAEAFKIEMAEKYQSTVINLPCSTNLKEDEIEYVVDCLKQSISY